MIQGRDWLWLLAINAIANVVIAATFGPPPAWPETLVSAWRGFIVSTTISGLCLIAIPRLVPILYRKLGSSTRWLLLVAMLVVLAAVGSTLGVGLLTVLGHVESWEEFVPRLQDTMRIAILVTVVVGAYATRNEGLRSQLDEATLALRTKERDEAEARRLASEAQLTSLESRVNPHFFFNTLNSIAALTREDAARAERMTMQLASLMRSSLNADATPLVPLEQEAQNVRDYLDIEQVRFGSRLRYDIRIAEEVRTALVPRLSVQTLVENSVKYAVSVQRGGASISVAADRGSSGVRVVVTDDGPGFDVASSGDGHGLELIRARLALLYQGEAALSVQSRPGRTTVSMDLPSAAHVA